MNATTRVPPSTKEILKRQAEEAGRQRAAIAQKRANATSPNNTTVVVTAKPTAVAAPDNRTPQQQYLDEIDPAGIVGRRIKFTREGKYVTADDDKLIDENATFIALMDQTLVGYQRFFDDGRPPDRRMSLYYDPNFVKPQREELGDLNEDAWPLGLSGQPEDPWQHYNFVVLQCVETGALFTFSTRSKTGRRAVGSLLKHYDRDRRTHPNDVPVVRLRSGGYMHPDDRIGFVVTPLFQIVNRQPRDSAAKPDTSIGIQLNDEIPFE
jgi:hypothetical protein